MQKDFTAGTSSLFNCTSRAVDVKAGTLKEKNGAIGCVGPPRTDPVVKQPQPCIASIENIHDGDIKGTSHANSMLPVRTIDVVDVDTNEAKNCAITDGSLPMTDPVIEQFSLYHAFIQTISDEGIETYLAQTK